MTPDETRDGVAPRAPAVTRAGLSAAGGRRSIIDTTEVRWFAPGSAPREVLRWFWAVGPTPASEERSDWYRLEGLPDIGVKRRFGELLELKVRRSESGLLVLPAGPAGPLEVWRKWSPADGLIGAHDDARWVAVHKVVSRKTMRLHPQSWAAEGPGGLEPPGCDIEITRVHVGDVEAWSLAVSAYGPIEHRLPAITESWATLVRELSPPPVLADRLRVCAAFPSWLRAVVDQAGEWTGSQASP